MNAPAFQTIVAAPGFCLGVRCDTAQIVEIAFLEPQSEVAPASPLAKEVARQLRAYLDEPRFEFSLPLAPAGTPFQQRVWGAIAAILLGETCTYGDLAARLSSSPRAVGNACGANPYPLIVPCHRVVAAGGSGGFNRQRGGFPLGVKRWLLEHEGVR